MEEAPFGSDLRPNFEQKDTPTFPHAALPHLYGVALLAAYGDISICIV